MLSINCKGRLIQFDTPKVMGIINATPDSFYASSRQGTLSQALRTAEKMLVEGAVFLDIGGQSTRPGSGRVKADDELERVVPVVHAIAHRFPEAIISIDTFYASVAMAAVSEGAQIINDVSAGSIDPALLSTVAHLGVPYVLMHMQGDPQTMQHQPQYKNVVLDVFDVLNFRLKEIVDLGINDVIIDPGFGFGKTANHNLKLLNGLRFFQQLGKPVLAGISRKATICKTLGVSPEEALNGTTILNTIALLNGAHILRVHDVKEAVEAVKLTSAMRLAAV